MTMQPDTQRITITGGAGFIGANFVRYALAHTSARLVVLDATLDVAVQRARQTSAGEFLQIEGDDGVHFSGIVVSKAFEGNDMAYRSACDIAFHQAISESAHNVLFGHLAATMLSLLENNIRLNLTELKEVPGAADLLHSQHRALYEAIRNRKPAAARAAAETHIDFVHATLAQSLRSAARRETAARRLNSAQALGTDFLSNIPHHSNSELP